MVYYILYFYLPALWFRRAWGEDTLNSRKPQKFAEPGLRMCLLIMLIFALVTFFFARFNRYIAYGEAVVTVLLAIYALIRARARQKELQAFVENVTYNAESATNNTLIHFPLPMAVFRLNDSGVVWGNQPFWEMCGRTSPAFDAKLASLVPEFNSKWLLEGKNRMADLLEVDGKKYQVNGNMVRAGEREETYEFMGITYWVDVTEYDDVKQEYLATRPVVMVMLVDNYDELMKPLTDRQRTELRGQLDIAIEKWCEGRGGILRRVDRDRYIFIFEKRHFDEITKNRFTLVESIHSIVNLTGIHATVSIGVGLDGASYDEDYSFATLAEDMALSRGGDQAVVKNKFNFEFFGGRGAEVETRTKVKSRVMANSLSRLVQDASQVFIMGHRYADLDAVGAAVGVRCIARRFHCPAKIVLDMDKNAVGPLLTMLHGEEEYKTAFISAQEALLEADSRTLLVVVDTNRPEQVEDESLLTAPVSFGVRLPSKREMQRLINEIRRHFDFCLIDAAAGIGEAFALATCCADRAVVVTTNDPSSLRDAQRTVMELHRFPSGSLHLVVNRVRRKLLQSLHTTIDDAIDAAGLPLLGVIPEDENVPAVLGRGLSQRLKYRSGALCACENIARRLCGERVRLMRL